MIDPKEIKELRKAILDDDEKKVVSLLKRSTELASDWRPVMAAASLGREAILRLLIDHYADVDAKSSVGDYRPLHRAIHPEGGQSSGPGHKAVIELLLKNGADIESRATPNLITPLMMAALAGSNDLVALLLSKGAKLTFFSAVAVGDLKKIKEFLKKDPQIVRARDVNGWTALHYCAASRLGESDPKIAKDLKAIAELLIKGGLEATVLADTMGCVFTPLRLALFNLSVAEVLLSNGADPNFKDQDGKTVLHAAAARGKCTDVVKLLLRHGAGVQEVDGRGRTPYDIAESKRHVEIMKVFEQADPSLAELAEAKQAARAREEAAREAERAEPEVFEDVIPGEESEVDDAVLPGPVEIVESDFADQTALEEGPLARNEEAEDADRTPYEEARDVAPIKEEETRNVALTEEREARDVAQTEEGEARKVARIREEEARSVVLVKEEVARKVARTREKEEAREMAPAQEEKVRKAAQTKEEEVRAAAQTQEEKKRKVVQIKEEKARKADQPKKEKAQKAGRPGKEALKKAVLAKPQAGAKKVQIKKEVSKSPKRKVVIRVENTKKKSKKKAR